MNSTGIQPVEYKVLILPDEVEDRSAGGMFLPDSVRERQQYAMDKGTIIDFGLGFFTDIPGPKPKIGDRVIFNKYAGSTVQVHSEGKRKDYRLCNDKDICAIMEVKNE